MNTYLFPIFVTLSYYVSFQGKTDMPCVCFVCNGSDGHILGYALSVGAPKVSLYDRAVLHLKSTGGVQNYPLDAGRAFKVLPTPLVEKSFWADTNQPKHSLNWRVKSKSAIIDAHKIGYHLLPYLYDWTIEDFDMLRNRLLGEPYGFSFGIKYAFGLIDLAVERFNKSLAEKEFEVHRDK